MKFWLDMFVVHFYVVVYRIFYFKRYKIGYGKIDNQIEIYKVRMDEYRKTKDDKFRLVFPFKTIKL